MSPAQRRWLGFALLVAWGLVYIAVFAYLKWNSRDFLLTQRLQAVCNEQRCPRLPLPVHMPLDDLAKLPEIMVSGWGHPEPGGVWTIAKQAYLSLPIDPSAAYPLRVKLDVEAALSEAVTSQRVRVMNQDGTTLAEHRLTQNASLGTLDFLIRQPDANPSGAVILSVSVPDAWVQAKHTDSADQRLLGVRLRRLSITPESMQ